MCYSIDFIMEKPLCNVNNAIFTCLDRLTKYSRLTPFFSREGALSASSVAKFFFDNVARYFGIPMEVIANRDPRFTASFW